MVQVQQSAGRNYLLETLPNSQAYRKNVSSASERTDFALRMGVEPCLLSPDDFLETTGGASR